MQQSDIELLYTVPPYHLQALAKLRHLPLSFKGETFTPSSIPPLALLTEIAEQLFNPAALSESIQNLGEPEALILRELVACGGRANSRDLALYLASSGLIGREKGTEVPPTSYQSSLLYPNPHPHGPFEQALRRLLLQGLLFWGRQTNFAGRDYTSGVYDGILIVPQAVMDVANNEWAKKHGEAPTGDVVAGSGEHQNVATPLVGVVGGGALALQRTLYLYWSLVEITREGLQIVSSGLLSRSALRLVVGQLSPKSSLEQIRAENEVPHLLFIRLLMLKLGLLYNRRGALYAAPAEDFFSLPLLERARRCYRLWLETPFWNELCYLPDVIVRPLPNPLDSAHEEVIRSRQAIAERVLSEQPGAWCEFPAFIARTKLYIPYLLFPRQYGSRADRYSIGSNPYGYDFRLRRGWLTHREGWHMVEGGFIRAVVGGPLHWLGLVETNSMENPGAFRLIPGASLITSETPSDINEPPGGRLIVQPNFELVALAPVSESLLIKLDRFAERTRLEHIAQYRLTKASVTRAITLGLHAETIQQTLEQAAGGEIPQNVQYSLVEWERQARRIELWRGATLLEVDDPTLLDALFADEGTSSLLGRRLTPSLAEVAPHGLSAVQEALWRRNYLPALAPAPMHDNLLESGHLLARETQWRFHEDGLLEPLHAVLDLYLVAELERLSELNEATGWRRITPSAIQRARSTGLSLEHIVHFLQNYCEGGIPPSFLIRLKLWGGGYGEQSTIRVEHAPLLSLSTQALQDLQADEELKTLLGPEVAQGSRLVHVNAENIERVVELLRKRGFVVESL